MSLPSAGHNAEKHAGRAPGGGLDQILLRAHRVEYGKRRWAGRSGWQTVQRDDHAAAMRHDATGLEQTVPVGSLGVGRGMCVWVSEAWVFMICLFFDG